MKTSTGCKCCAAFLVPCSTRVGVHTSSSVMMCDATNETSVSDMLCRDNKEACRHCMETVTVLRTRGGPRRKQSQANLLALVNILLDIIWSSSRTPSFPGHPFGPRSVLFHPLFCRVGFLVDAFSLGLLYRSGEPLSPLGGTINGKLLANQTTVFVDITITTILVRAAKQ
jgi:hypothetical protein